MVAEPLGTSPRHYLAIFDFLLALFQGFFLMKMTTRDNFYINIMSQPNFQKLPPPLGVAEATLSGMRRRILGYESSPYFGRLVDPIPNQGKVWPESIWLKKVNTSQLLLPQHQSTVVCKKVHKIGLYGVKWP